MTEEINYGYLTVPKVIGEYLIAAYNNVFDEIRENEELPEFFNSDHPLPYEFVELPTNASIGTIRSILEDFITPYFHVWDYTEEYSVFTVKNVSQASKGVTVTFTSLDYLTDIRNLTLYNLQDEIQAIRDKHRSLAMDMSVISHFAPMIAQSKLSGELHPLERE